jgi:ABC-2 type transport system permease protein
VKFLRDTWLIFASSVKTTLRTPVFVIVGIFQPACYLLLFAPILQNIGSSVGFPSSNALEYFTPGVLVMMALFGSAFAGIGLISELRYGIIERLRVTPVSRFALLLGRALRDILVLLVQSILLLLIALPLGFRADPPGVIITLLLLLLVGLMAASCSYALALLFKNENAMVATLNFFTMPLLLLSGILLPLTLAPVVIRDIARIDPFAYTVNAARALFNGNLGDSAIPLGFGVLAVLALLALYWAARLFRNALA